MTNPTLTDWQKVKLGEVLRIGNGRDYKHLNNGSVPVFGTGGLMTNVDDFLYNGKSVFIGRKGTIDKPFFYDGKFWTVDTLFYTHSFKNIIPEFVYLVFQKIDWKKHNEASGVPSLSKTNIENIKAVLPPLPEQKRIVAVLETWDEALEKLNRKIEIKQSVKKGLMQKLLTGKVRLKGFSEPWKTIRFGEFCEISRGGSPRPIQNYITDDKSGLNWLKIGDIRKGARFIELTSQKITKEGLNKTTQVEPGDFILSNSMSFGRPYIMRIKACIHDGWLALKNINSNVDKHFLYYKISSEDIQSKFISISAGSGVQNLKKESVKCLSIKMPSGKEQAAIAQILTTADDEISALEKKRDILAGQKKYLLNNLITGNIRTPRNLKTS